MSGGIVCERAAKAECFRVSDPGKPAPICDHEFCPGRHARDRVRLLAKLPEIIRCDGCDNGLERGWTYCAHCGRKIEAEDAA